MRKTVTTFCNLTPLPWKNVVTTFHHVKVLSHNNDNDKLLKLQSKFNFEAFLADRTNGRAIATLLRLSVCLSSVTLCIVAKRCVL